MARFSENNQECVVKSDHAMPCRMCKELTFYVDIFSEDRMCSDECRSKFDHWVTEEVERYEKLEIEQLAELIGERMVEGKLPQEAMKELLDRYGYTKTSVNRVLWDMNNTTIEDRKGGNK